MDNLSLFNYLSERYVEMAFERSYFLSGDITAQLEMLLQEESNGYLDLALPINPSENDRRRTDQTNNFFRYKNWKTLIKTQVQSVLPEPIKEFFLAEILDENQPLTGLCRRVTALTTNRLEVLRDILQTYRADLFIQFESMLFNEVAGRDDLYKSRNIRKYLRAYEVFQVNRFAVVCPFLIQLCIGAPLDYELTMDVLRTLCDIDTRKLDVFRHIYNGTSLTALICHAKAMRFDFWGIWSGFGDLSLEFDFIHRFMVMGVNQEYSRILLKYGFPYLSYFEEYNNRCMLLQSLTFNEEEQDGRLVIQRPVLRSVQPLYEKAHAGYSTRMMLIMDTFLIFGDFSRTWVKKDCVRTLAYLARTLSEPYVTSSELCSTMEQVVVPQFLTRLKAIAERYSEAAIFEEEYVIPSPRRLMHLCRVAIRKRLASNFKLLDGIEDLDIPTGAKAYLKLDW